MHAPRRRFLAFTAIGAVAALAGCSTMGSYSGDALMSSLTSGGGGLSTAQAAGGLGALTSLAQSRLGSDYAAFAKLLPSADKYLEAAKSAGLLSTPITNVAGLNNAFAKLNIEPMQAKGLLDGVSAYLTKQGGEAGRSLLARALSV
jgi:hypothetical protein